jgi:uncharacterized protein YcfJ
MTELKKRQIKQNNKMQLASLIMSGILFSAAANAAETRVDTVIGTVVDTITLTSTYVRKTPSNQRSCRTEDVPIYAEQQGNSELGSMIIGGLIGSAIGNKMSDNNGAGAAGTVAGALLGREHAKNNTKSGRVVGYKQQEVCSTSTVILEETVNEVTGYRNHIEIGGEIIKLQTKTPLAVGSRVEVQRRTTYSLR